MNNLYNFTDGNKLEDRNTYFYIPFNGIDFIKEWKNNRRQVLSEIKSFKIFF